MRAVNLFFNRMFNAIENVTVFTAAVNISYKLSSVGYRVKAQWSAAAFLGQWYVCQRR